MGHQTDYPQKLPTVPHIYLQRREKRYYFRVKVPVDLQESMGKRELKSALGTSDHREACRLVNTEAVKANARFQSERRKIVKLVSRTRRPVAIGESGALCLIASRFEELERESADWLEANLEIFQHPEELPEALEKACLDEFVHSGGRQAGTVRFQGENGESAVASILSGPAVKFVGSPDLSWRNSVHSSICGMWMVS